MGMLRIIILTDHCLSMCVCVGGVSSFVNLYTQKSWVVHFRQASWPQRNSSSASSARFLWWWGWESERWTTTGHAGWCSRSSCGNALRDTEREHGQVPRHFTAGYYSSMAEAAQNLNVCCNIIKDLRAFFSCACFQMIIHCFWPESTYPLVILLFLDLLHLIQKLSDPQLQFRQLVLGCNFWVVVGVFTHLNVQMDSLRRKELD